MSGGLDCLVVENVSSEFIHIPSRRVRGSRVGVFGCVCVYSGRESSGVKDEDGETPQPYSSWVARRTQYPRWVLVEI